MSSAQAILPLVVVLGPTASGKSTLGVWLAERFGGEILACDSTQLYRGFDIGTAKPAVAERRGIPHHLLDVLDANETATAGDYREKAIVALEGMRQKKRLPILTAGTGLYLRALLDGLAELPQRSEEIRERLRASAEEHGPGHLHEMMKKLDSEAAEKIATEDEQKLIRAIEICLLTNKTLSEVHRTGRIPLMGWRAIKIGLQPERGELQSRIARRTETMLANGWLEEVQSLMDKGFAEDAKPFDFIGYRELRAVVRGEMKLEEAKSAIQLATRQYAKRQATWFRREPNVHWLSGFGDEESVQKSAAAILAGEGLPVRA